MSRTISESVVVEIRINRAGEVESDVENIGRKSTSAFGAIGGAVATISKALLSMAAVIVVWTAFITIPEAIASNLKKLAVVAIESADEMQRQIFNTAGLLASFATFGPTVASSFQVATVASEKLLIQFAALASKSVASATDIQLAFQTLVSRGGLSFTKSLSEAADLAYTLTNIVVSLTGGLNKERQIVSEISALFEGQARTGAVVAKIIKAQVGDLDTWLTKMKQAGPGALNDALKQMFSGIDQASAALGETIGGILASIQGNLAILNRIVQQAGGGFEVIINWLRQWRDLLAEAVMDIGRVNGGFETLKESTQIILHAMTQFSVAIGIILDSLNRMLLALLGASTQLQAVENFGNALLRLSVLIASLMDFISREIQIIYSGLDLGALTLLNIYETVVNLPGAFAKAREEVDKQQQGLTELLKKLSQQNDWIHLNNDADKEATDNIKRKLVELQKELELAIANGNPFAQIWIRAKQQIADAVIEMKKFPAELQKAKDLINQTARANEQNLLVDQKRTADIALARALNGDMVGLLLQQQVVKDQISVAYAGDAAQLSIVNEQYQRIADKQIELLQHQQASQFRGEENSMIAQINQLTSGGDKGIAITDQYIERLQALYDKWHVGSKELGPLINLLDRLTDAERKALDVERFFQSVDSLINAERTLRDNISESIRLMGIGTKSALEISGGYASIRYNLDLLTDKLNENAMAMAGLNAQKGVSVEQDAKVLQKQRELSLESSRIKTQISETVSAIRQMEDASVKLSDVIANLIVRVGDLHQGLRAAFADELPNLLKSVGQLGADALTGAINGSEKFAIALKKALASEISAIGTRTMAQGLANLAQGIWPFNPVQLAAGAKQIAAGAAIVALASRLSPQAQTSTAGASASGGGQQSQTVLLTPFGFNPANATIKTLENLNATIDRLNTMPAGVVVAGAVKDPATAQVVTKSVAQSLQGDQQTRADMSKTLAGNV